MLGRESRVGVLLAELQLPHLGHFHTKLTVQTSVKKEAHHTVHFILQPLSIVFQEIIGSFKDNPVRFTLGNLKQPGSRDPQALTTLEACAQSEPVLLNAQPGKGRAVRSNFAPMVTHFGPTASTQTKDTRTPGNSLPGGRMNGSQLRTNS